ncbi:hypothetical protein [Deinococcus frigens]|uniref:hypothetical protein n=1 Tax=Deinococcus frigens TaxID=249403 RepID=UPI0004969BCA|nr:hypothetical protein [Deinococcus frigens]
MKNKKHWAYTGGSISVALTVPAGTKSGDLVKLGTDDLYGHAETDQATADMVSKGTAPQGLVENQATVFLPGIVESIGVPATAIAAVAAFGKVYLKADKSYGATPADGLFVGYKLNATTIALRAN